MKSKKGSPSTDEEIRGKLMLEARTESGVTEHICDPVRWLKCQKLTYDKARQSERERIFEKIDDIIPRLNDVYSDDWEDWREIRKDVKVVIEELKKELKNR